MKPRVDRRARQWGLGLVVVAPAAALGWLWLRPTPMAATAPVAPAPTAQRQALAMAAPPEPVSPASPATPLACALDAPSTQEGALTLFGTLAGSDATSGYAVVGHSRAGSGVFAPGATLAPGVILREVFADHVTVECGGVRRVMAIAGGAGGTPARARPSLPGRVPERPIAGAIAGQASRPGAPGVEVFAGRDRVAFARLGLRPGDVVTAVNHVPVGSSVADIPRLLGDSPQATITVIRHGQMQEIAVGGSGP